MKQDYNEVTSNTQTLSEIKNLFKKMHSLPEVTRHINLAKHLMTFTSKISFRGLLDVEQTIVETESFDICLDYIEEMMHKQEPLASAWLRVKRALQLVIEHSDTANPNDIDYVFSGYAPLSIRLVQHAIQSGCRPIEETLKLLPGPHSETKRGPFSSSASFDNFQGAETNVDKVDDGKRSLVLVIFIRGVTFAEISALRFLSSRKGMAYNFIVGTTKMVSGHSLTETFVGKMEDL
ncbi:putative sec1-like protein [Rosa chinensis]|uniref:Putative sec1-like protein n=1 Tax=Rosa chinensis TaxID=74649 RepID=A0A2P6PH64_ROSCH|nr:putative sec1-like protein [Rosa chinensis]